MHVDPEHFDSIVKAHVWAWAAEALPGCLSLVIIGGTLCAFARSTGHVPERAPSPTAKPKLLGAVAAARARRNPFAM